LVAAARQHDELDAALRGLAEVPGGAHGRPDAADDWDFRSLPVRSCSVVIAPTLGTWT